MGPSLPLAPLCRLSSLTPLVSTWESVTHGRVLGSGPSSPAPSGSRCQPLGGTQQGKWGLTEGRASGLRLGWKGRTRPEGPSPGPLGPRTLTHSRTPHSAPASPVIPPLGCRPLPSPASTSSQFPAPLARQGPEHAPTLPPCQALPSLARPPSPPRTAQSLHKLIIRVGGWGRGCLHKVMEAEAGRGAGGASGVEFCRPGFRHAVGQRPSPAGVTVQQWPGV